MNLPRRERGVLIQACVLLPVVEVALRILGFQRTLRVMEWGVSHRCGWGMVPAIGQVESTVRMVVMAARHGIHTASCLRRAMVAWFLLRRQGVEMDMRIGVRKKGAGTVEAHAWVEYKGCVVADPEASAGRYKALESPNSPW